jgi:predicted ATPase
MEIRMPDATVFEFTPYRLVPAQRQLVRDGIPVKLGGRAFDVLVALVERRERTVSKNELMDLAWPTVVVEENNLEVQIVTLRKLLGYAAIATIPGRGYRFTLSVTLPEGAAASQDPSSIAESVRPMAELPQLFGRDEELNRLSTLLATHRLVTVTGSAGIGKTRLAQTAAERYKTSSGDDAWFVDLAPLSNASLIPSTLASALGLTLGTRDALSAVSAAVKDGSPLLVIDNAEHLLDGVASAIVRLHRETTGARFLVTSQEPMHVENEFVLRLEPLSLPSGDDPERIADSGAVALFVARAQAADRRFALRPSNSTAVAEICRRLDGIPLAIELAAARVPLLGTDGLRDKLDQRFHVLTAGRRELPRRQQTLRAALDWSHHLLSEQEQAVFRRIGAFVGGFTLEAAQTIASDEIEIDQWDVLEHIGALVEKSLVVAEGESLPRYRMLETSRLFALERLIESGEAEDVRRRHRDFFLNLAEKCDKTILSDEARAVLGRLDSERDNLLSAMNWAVNEQDVQPGLRLACALAHYWYVRAMLGTGAELTAVALARGSSAAPCLTRCRTLATAGWLSMLAGKDQDALKYMEDALAMARKLNVSATLCHVLARYAYVRYVQNEVKASHCLAVEALELGRELGETIELGDALVIRGRICGAEGDANQARQLLLEGIQLRRRTKNIVGLGNAIVALAELELSQRNMEQVRTLLAEVTEIVSALDAVNVGIYLAGVTADYAATIGNLEAALLFDSIRVRYLKSAGEKDWARPEEEQWFLKVTSTVPESRRQALIEEGRSLNLEQVLCHARTFLASAKVSTNA